MKASRIKIRRRVVEDILLDNRRVGTLELMDGKWYVWSDICVREYPGKFSALRALVNLNEAEERAQPISSWIPRTTTAHSGRAHFEPELH